MLVVREFCKFGDEHDFVRPWPCYSAVGVVPSAGTVVVLFVSDSRQRSHKFVFEDLKRTSYFVIAVLIACVRYLKMVSSRNIGGRKAGRKRRAPRKRMTREAMRPSPPGVVVFKCLLRKDVSGSTAIQQVTRRESEPYRVGASFLEKNCASSFYGSIILDSEISWRAWIEMKPAGVDPDETFPLHLYAPAPPSDRMLQEFHYVRHG